MTRTRLLVINDPHAMRIDRDLAAEIGLNESIMLLQLEYLISIGNKEHDGRLWTYQSLQGMHDTIFPWWSVMTISRLVKDLEKRDLIVVSNYNRSGFDRTQWFALNEVGIARLNAVRMAEVSPVLPDEPPISQDDTSISQNGTSMYQVDKSISQNEKSISQIDRIDHNKMVNRSYQNETTIPKTTTKTTAKTTKQLAAADHPEKKETAQEIGARLRLVLKEQYSDE